MKYYLDIDRQPNFQKIIITSAFLHILFIALIAVPLKTKEREYKSYFVDLVTPVEIQEPPWSALSDTPLIKIKKATIAKPPKKQQRNKTKLNKTVTAESRVIKRDSKIVKMAEEKKKTMPARLLQQIGKNNNPSRGEFSIKRDAHNPKGISLKEPVPAGTGYRGSVFTAKKGLHKQEGNIARKSKTIRPDTVSMDKGYGLPIFTGKEEEDFRKQRVMIARVKGSVQSGTVTENSETDLYGNSDIDAMRDIEFDSLEKTNGSEIIEKPSITGGSPKKETPHGGQDGVFIGNADFQGLGGNADNGNVLSSEISIQGVPLDDLSACTNALDERKLKKKILNVVGNSKGCYNPASGKFLFIGTARFASFDMIIMPEAGRELSDRCEELRNAFYCLTSAE
jgi:hypothetical protein